PRRRKGGASGGNAPGVPDASDPETDAANPRTPSPDERRNPPRRAPLRAGGPARETADDLAVRLAVERSGVVPQAVVGAAGGADLTRPDERMPDAFMLVVGQHRGGADEL